MRKFKLIVYALAVAIVSAVVLSSCTTEVQRNRIERAAILKVNATNDSINALPITVYCAMIEGYDGDSLLFHSTYYDRDSMDLEIALALEKDQLRKYAVDVDSVAVNKWQVIAK